MNSTALGGELRALWWLGAATAIALLGVILWMSGLFHWVGQSDFMPHGVCYRWNEELLWLHVGSDSLVAASYFAIPFCLIYFVTRRKGLKMARVFWLFGAFIFLCGMTHLLEVYSVWHGVYRFTGLVKLATGLVSLVTAGYLVRNLPSALRIPLPEEMERANRALVERQRLFETVVQGGLDGFLLIEPASEGSREGRGFRVEIANRVASRMLGVAESEAMGGSLSHLGKLGRELAIAASKALEGEEPSEGEIAIERGKGRFAWYSAQWVPVDRRLAVFVRDITDRKESEIELRETREALEDRVAVQNEELWKSENRYQRLSEFAYSAVWLSDASGKVTQPMPRWSELTGQAEEEYWDWGWLEAYHEEDRERLQESWSRCVAEQSPFRSEARIWSAQKKEFVPVMSMGVPITNSQGKIMEWIGAVHDLSDLKRQERILADYAQQLNERNRYLQEFAYVASHDLQEPLRKIRSYGDILNEDFGLQLGEEGKKYIEIMRSASGRMSKLIEDMLLYSRATSAEMEVEELDLNRIVSEVMGDMEISIKESGAEIENRGLPRVAGDPTMVRQVFQNLLGNAIKYSREGTRPKITLSSRLRRKEDLDESLSRGSLAESFQEIAIADNGIGFDPKFADRIFKPFQRLHGRGAYSGSGIGLAICQRIMARKNGFIRVESKPGEGSVFLLYFPVS